ncbi:MAG: sigma 54-interacting transcriptional regulator [Nitrospinota bacterium]
MGKVASMKTMIVGHDFDMLVFLEKILRSRGHQVSACMRGEEALEAYEREPHPLVVLDLELEDVDGLDLCRQIRALPQGDQSVILVVTARNQPGDLEPVLEAGADDYLNKPVEPGFLNVRLAIAEERVCDLVGKKQAEGKLQKSHDDMLALLNQLRVGTAMTDENGCLSFLSQAGQRLFGVSQEEVLGRHWEEVCPFQEEDRESLKDMFARPANLRTKFPIHLETPGGRHNWVEIEVQEDPRSPQRKIFFLYDISEVYDLRNLLSKKTQFRDLVGKSKAMRVVYQQIQEVSRVDSTVLIEGKTGTGKEMVARAIHFTSHRKDGPFIIINCAGLSESLLESQLFGHKKGAFTGAMEDHKGLFETADHGTIFLDEIGDIPMNVQTRLLRVLQEREITRLGESRPRKIDVRVLAATHQDLDQEVEKGSFRLDLLYRIRVARIHLPPLRERQEDIPLLVSLFLRQCRAATSKPVQDISPDAMELLLEYSWPGNVRELQNAIESAVIRAKGSALQLDDLPPEIVDATPPQLPTDATPEDEKEQLMTALERARGNRSVAARKLGISRATLYRRLATIDKGVG